jgi:hypothetical protein
LEELLRQTATTYSGERTGVVPRVPRHFPEVAEAIVKYRGTLELGGTFPAELIDLIVAQLQS